MSMKVSAGQVQDRTLRPSRPVPRPPRRRRRLPPIFFSVTAGGGCGQFAQQVQVQRFHEAHVATWRRVLRRLQCGCDQVAKATSATSRPWRRSGPCRSRRLEAGSIAAPRAAARIAYADGRRAEGGGHTAAALVLSMARRSAGWDAAQTGEVETAAWVGRRHDRPAGRSPASPAGSAARRHGSAGRRRAAGRSNKSPHGFPFTGQPAAKSAHVVRRCDVEIAFRNCSESAPARSLRALPA